LLNQRGGITPEPGKEAVSRYEEKQLDGRVRCRVCPHECVLAEGAAGLCGVRRNQGGTVVSAVYGRCAGLAVDPVEKKPLYHFLPGSNALSFGTAGCNLFCRFCQNPSLSRAREPGPFVVETGPEEIAAMVRRYGCRSVAFTYNEPVVFLEYAVDTARACRARGLKTLAVTAGYVQGEARADFFEAMDAANVDLKAFTESFYRDLCGAKLAPVLDTLRYLRHQTSVWLELTTLLIPGRNDSDDELHALTRWVADELGPEVPLHFSAFHPVPGFDEIPSTSLETLHRARGIAQESGLRFVYLGNIRDPDGGITRCGGCGAELLSRAGYRTAFFQLNEHGVCRRCGTRLPGVF
jgi:pyruvate formate lyase activating enzyme